MFPVIFLLVSIFSLSYESTIHHYQQHEQEKVCLKTKQEYILNCSGKKTASLYDYISPSKKDAP